MKWFRSWFRKTTQKPVQLYGVVDIPFDVQYVFANLASLGRLTFEYPACTDEMTVMLSMPDKETITVTHGLDPHDHEGHIMYPMVACLMHLWLLTEQERR